MSALAGVDVEFERGQFTAIMEPSGSGKSTLMHVLAGLDTASAGSVLLGDGPDEPRRHRAVDPAPRAHRLRVPGVQPAAGAHGAREHAAAYDFGGAAARPRLAHLPHELSGGQQQRVAVARALLPRPTVIFADEPTGNLDSHSGEQVLDLLRSSVRETGLTVVMVTHDPVAASYADRVVLLADGLLAGEVLHPTPDTVSTAMRGLGVAALAR